MRLPGSLPVVSGRSVVTRRLAATAATLVLTALGAGAVAPAAGADVTVPACEGTTTQAISPQMLTLTGAREAAFDAGHAVVLYTNDGTYDGGNATPACATHKMDGTPVSEWAYCTDLQRYACVSPDDPALAPVTGNPKFDPSVDPLGPDKEKVIAYLAQHDYPVRNASSLGAESAGITTAGNGSTGQRHAIQEMIWCISQAGPGQKTATWLTCTQNFTANDFDAVLALFPAAPSLTIAAPSPATVEVGAVARFAVTTNVVGQPIALELSDNATWAVCAGDATLLGTTLTVDGGSADETTVTLCATTTAAGALSVAATTTPASERNLVWSWNGDDDCQVFATFTAAKVDPLRAAASATVRAVPTTPETPTTPDTPTVPETPTTPATPSAPESLVKPARISTLRITKRSDARRVRPGQRVTYRIRVTNPSRRAARNVRVCDTLPAGLRFVRASRGVQVRNGRYCWTAKRLAPKASRTYRLVARVVPGAPQRVVNRATASSPDAVRTARAARPVVVRERAPRPGGVTG